MRRIRRAMRRSADKAPRKPPRAVLSIKANIAAKRLSPNSSDHFRGASRSCAHALATVATRGLGCSLPLRAYRITSRRSAPRKLDPCVTRISNLHHQAVVPMPFIRRRNPERPGHRVQPVRCVVEVGGGHRRLMSNIDLLSSGIFEEVESRTISSRYQLTRSQSRVPGRTTNLTGVRVTRYRQSPFRYHTRWATSDQISHGEFGSLRFSQRFFISMRCSGPGGRGRCLRCGWG